MTTGDPEKMREFQMRPHNGARTRMTHLIAGMCRDDFEILSRPCPHNDIGWMNYFDEVYLARLNYIGEKMGWEAPVMTVRGGGSSMMFDSVNVERAAQWKTTYHVMQMMMTAELVNQIMVSKRFDDHLAQFGTKLNQSETPEIFALFTPASGF